MKNLGTNIFNLRVKSGLTQSALAKKLNVTTATIYRLEKNQFSPSIETVIKLAQVFDVSTDSLLLMTPQGNKIKSSNANLSKRLQAIEKLTFKDQQALFDIIDAFLKSKR